MKSVVEKWRPLNGRFTGWPYEVSDSGRVRNVITGRIRHPTVKTNGYLRIILANNCTRGEAAVHRLVLSAFDRPPSGDLRADQVNHKDGDKTNNRLENLEWVTCRQNHEHAVEMGLREKIGVGHFRRKLTNDQVREVRMEMARGESIKDIADKYMVSCQTIYVLRRGISYQDVA